MTTTLRLNETKTGMIINLKTQNKTMTATRLHSRRNETDSEQDELTLEIIIGEQ